VVELRIDDPEGERVPEGIRVIDAHTHLFPDELFAALWRWFDSNAWPIRYQLSSVEAATFLLDRGVEHTVALIYPHKPGMAQMLNGFMAGVMAKHSGVWGLGSVMPGEPGDRDIVRRALGEQGLCGVKIHCHVQSLSPDDARLDVVYEEAARAGKPVLIHAGSGPSLGGYGTDPGALCRPELMADALGRHPDTTVVVPHLGADHIEIYLGMLAEFPNLHLDNTMAVAGYFGPDPARELFERHADRILFGSDFPNIPYAWDRELKRVLAMELTDATLDSILWKNAEALYAPSTNSRE
jgi:hypothetical protein